MSSIFDQIKEVANRNMDSVVGLKLSTGEFIIGSISNSLVSGEPRYLHKPIMIVLNGQGGVTFMPWVISSDDDYDLDNIAGYTIVAASVPDNLISAYMEQTGQRKVLAPAGARGEPRILVN